MKKLNKEQFDKIKNTDGLKVVDFYADWCSPCKMLAPVLEELSLEMSDAVEFVKINIDENLELAQEYGITTIPTLVFIKDGKELNRKIGFMFKNSLKDEILNLR